MTHPTDRWPDQADAWRTRGVPDLPLVKRHEHTTLDASFRVGLRASGTPGIWSPVLKEYVYWTAPPSSGQILKSPNPNIYVIVEPRWRAQSVIVIEYGCDHDYETVAKRMCYSEHRCRTCGYHWGVDSSD